MAQKKISDLTAAGSVAATDVLEIETTAPASRKATAAQLAAYINALLTVGASANYDTFAEVEARIGERLAKAGGALTGPVEMAGSVDVASAATTDIGAAASNIVRITGTTTITALGTIAAGAVRLVRFAGILTLTHNATSLILPRARNIVTAANDFAIFVSEGSGNWRCHVYIEASRPNDAAAPVRMKDEFMFGSGESGELGDLGWSITNGSAALSTPETNHPGVLVRTSGAVASQIASMYTASAGSVPVIRFDQVQDCHWTVKPDSTATDCTIRIGFSADFTTETPAHGFYFERLAADTNWFIVSRNGSTETRTDTGVAFAANWTTLRLRRVDASTVAFSIDGAAEQTIVTNVPDASDTLAIGNMMVPNSTTARNLRIDFFSLACGAQAR